MDGADVCVGGWWCMFLGNMLAQQVELVVMETGGFPVMVCNDMARLMDGVQCNLLSW